MSVIVEKAALTCNIAAHLRARALEHPQKSALIRTRGRTASGSLASEHMSFAQLERESDRVAHGLERAGIGRGTRAAMLVPPGFEFFTLAFALFKVGAVMVLVDRGLGVKNIFRCLREAEPEAFIGIPAAHVARVIAGGVPSARTLVTIGRRLLWGGLTMKDLRGPRGPRSAKPFGVGGDAPQAREIAATRKDEPAAILFTSGSTGAPKGVVYEHGMFDAQVRTLAATYAIGPDEIDLPTFPLFALFDPAIGLTAALPDMDPSHPARADPRMLVELIEEHAVTHMFGSPALLDRLGRHGAARGLKLPTLRRVISAGAPVAPAVIERIAGMLGPDAQVHTPYGATESLPIATIGSREILSETRARTAAGAGTCVGRPAGDMEVRVIRITEDRIPEWSDDLLLPAGETGEIVVRGSVVTREYFARPEATALAKIRDGDRFWHRMGDVGRLDERGRLWFCGRKAQRVTTAAGTLFTDPVEGVFNQHPRVYRSALVGVGEPGGSSGGCPPAERTMRPVVLVELQEGDRGGDRKKLFDELRALALACPVTAAIDTFLVHPAFPVDIRHNAKIYREKLAPWAAARLAGS